jgi:protein gp37
VNKQYKDPNHRGIEWTQYTWNPIAGCLHGCAWTMPDGAVANCYAEDVADRLAPKAVAWCDQAIAIDRQARLTFEARRDEVVSPLSANVRVSFVSMEVVRAC